MKNSRSMAIITGATSGIGKEFACRFAAAGHDLIITGRRTLELRKVAEDLSSQYRVDVEVMTGDLADGRYCQELCEKIKRAGNIEVLVNNAGFGIDHAFHAIGIEDTRSMLYTHMIATVELIQAVLPGMIKRGSGTIINVSSLAAFTPGFSRSLYLGTKAFIHYFTEALFTEIGQFGIRMQSLCPGMTVSDFHRNTQRENFEKKMSLLPFMSPEQVVSTSLNALKTGWVLCIPGFWNKLFYISAKLLPTKVLMRISGFRKEMQDRLPEEIPFMKRADHERTAVALKHAS